MLGNTLAASFIWGINTIFLLDAGLSNAEAFAANAFFTAGMVLFEVPTGIVADMIGRRVSYLLGTLTLTASTVLYVLLWQVEAPLLGRGRRRRCCSGSDSPSSPARSRPGWSTRSPPPASTGELEAVFGRGQIVSGLAMLVGSVAGGLIAQATSLGVPFVIRAGVLLVMFVVAFRLMHDVGFTPSKRPAPARRDAQDRRRLDRVRLAGAGGQVADAERRCSAAGSGSTRSTPCSRTCSSSTATRPRTRSPGWSRRSSPARRSSAGSPRRASGGSFTAAPRRCSRCRRSASSPWR